MASIASRSSQALRAASRRVPRTVQTPKAASYSLLASRSSCVASVPRRTATSVEVRSALTPKLPSSRSDRLLILSFFFFCWSPQSVRGIKTLDFAGSPEVVYERSDWPLARLQDYFKNDTLALIGYGSQGHGQGLNARDNGMNVVVGVRENGESWKQAVEDGWVPGETLFPIEEAIKRGTIIMNLLSDAAQSATWPKLAPLITKGKTLYFSHGFSVVYKEDTKVVPPPDVDVILVAPKGSGRTVRTLFKEGRGINSSIAVWQDVSGKAKEKATAIGVAIGSGYMYETTFEKEVYSDLYGERGVVRTARCSFVMGPF